MSQAHQVLILGGGTGGLTVASQLLARDDAPDVAVIEPSDMHYYQPLWTLVGAGVFPKEESARPMAEVMPDGVTWIQDSVTAVNPEENSVTTESGSTYGYEYLVSALGLQLNWEEIPGLAESVGQPGTGVVSNYSYDTCETTWDVLQAFPAGGTAIFTEPTMGVKCGGAPQKIMYLADDAMRRRGVRERSRIAFMKAKENLFSSPYYEKPLHSVIERKGIELHLMTELIELQPGDKTAVFRDLKSGEEQTIEYDMIHVVPPMGAPDVVANSALAGEDGFVDVDPSTLRHTRYENVFALGDNSNLPTSKTGAAIRKQAPVVVDQLMGTIHHVTPQNGTYSGYTSCPLVTGYGKLILAEFDYEKAPEESFPFDQREERYSMYALKAYGLPRMYWNGMLKGRM